MKVSEVEATPGVLEKMSIITPAKKPHNNTSHLGTLRLIPKITYIYI